MDRKVFRGVLTILALSLYIVAIFLPWLSEHYYVLVLPLLQPEIFPPPLIPEEGLFWSFQALFSCYGRYRFADRLLLCDYWFGRSGLYLGWFGVFVFQALTVILIFISTFKEKMRGSKLCVVTTAVVSVMAPISCVFQRFKQLRTSLYIDFIGFSFGFWLAIASVVLLFISFLISSWTERRVSKSNAEPIL